MNEERKSFWNRAWNEPLHFFLWLTIFSILGLVVGVLLNTSLPHYHPPIWLQNGAIIVALGLGLGVAIGLMGFILSWIPPVRRLLAWLLGRRFFVLACVITVIALIYAEEDWRGWHVWKNFKTEWQAKGEKFDWEAFIPPAVPDDQNFAMSPVWIAEMRHHFYTEPDKAKDWYGERINNAEVARMNSFLPISAWRTNDNAQSLHIGSWREGKKTDLKSWQEYYRNPDRKDSPTEFPISAQPQSPATEVLLALSKYDPVIEELRRASQLPYSQFPINYHIDPGFMILLPHLEWVKSCGQALELRAIAELENNENEKALADVKLGLHLADAIRTEPFLISQLVRIAQVQIALQPVWEGLAEHKWSDAQLVEIDRAVGKFDFLTDYGFAMRGERILSVSSLDYTRRSGVWYGFDGSDDSLRVASLIMPSAFFYQNELTIAQMHQQWTLPLVDLENRRASPDLVKQNAIAADKSLQHFSPYNIFARLLFPAFSSAVKRFVQAQTSIDSARVAIALERYRLARGKFPDSLDALAPQFMGKIPHDIINGEPLHYRRTNDGQFVLYSVGWNETDDGGVVVFKKGSSAEVDSNQGDWVWRYPTK